ncbi:MAG: hypothetical protein PHW52_01930 [Candidatus Pacebacteria bacterium]|nr:hypothetical protein [Candidatus Paceibacterota bacterium]
MEDVITFEDIYPEESAEDIYFEELLSDNDLGIEEVPKVNDVTLVDFFIHAEREFFLNKFFPLVTPSSELFQFYQLVNYKMHVRVNGMDDADLLLIRR